MDYGIEAGDRLQAVFSAVPVLTPAPTKIVGQRWMRLSGLAAGVRCPSGRTVWRSSTSHSASAATLDMQAYWHAEWHHVLIWSVLGAGIAGVDTSFRLLVFWCRRGPPQLKPGFEATGVQCVCASSRWQGSKEGLMPSTSFQANLHRLLLQVADHTGQRRWRDHPSATAAVTSRW